MNRRKLFSFLGAAPVGALASLSLKEQPENLVRSDGAHKCECGCSAFHYAPKVAAEGEWRQYQGFEARCFWCQKPWTGPVPKDTLL